MSKMELRKALNGLGLSVDDDMATHLMQCYDKEGAGQVEFSKFVEDIDPSAFNFVFSAGMCAKSGSFECIEKEAVASHLDPLEKVRNTVRVCDHSLPGHLDAPLLRCVRAHVSNGRNSVCIWLMWLL